MTVEQLKQAGAIYVEHIRDGLETYDNEVVKMTGAEAEKYFLEKLHKYGSEKSFLDFYYFVLDEGARGRIDGQLSAKEKKFLNSMDREDGSFIFSAVEELVRIAAKLNDSEMLFSSFYFAEGEGKASIWWGNYGQEYLVFYS